MRKHSRLKVIHLLVFLFLIYVAHSENPENTADKIEKTRELEKHVIKDEGDNKELPKDEKGETKDKTEIGHKIDIKEETTKKVVEGKGESEDKVKKEETKADEGKQKKEATDKAEIGDKKNVKEEATRRVVEGKEELEKKGKKEEAKGKSDTETKGVEEKQGKKGIGSEEKAVVMPTVIPTESQKDVIKEKTEHDLKGLKTKNDTEVSETTGNNGTKCITPAIAQVKTYHKTNGYGRYYKTFFFSFLDL